MASVSPLLEEKEVKDTIVFTSAYVHLLKMLSISSKALMSGRKLDCSKGRKEQSSFSLSVKDLMFDSL